VVTRPEVFSYFYILVPFDNVDQGWQLGWVLIGGLGAFSISSHECHVAFPFMHNVFLFALHPDDRLHPVD
jgi:hypothetical protein